MAGVNKIILLGNLGQDPEVKHMDGGMCVARFSIATSESYTNKSGERVESTEWHRIEAWDKLAEIAEKWLKKGSTVYVEGKIKTETWTDKEGKQREGKTVRINTLQMIGGKQGESVPREAAPTQSQESGGDSDGLPF